MTAGHAVLGVPERVRVYPGRLSGTVQVPGDKSLSHRALILGALAGGSLELRGLALSGDVMSTVSALQALGATFDLDAAAGRALSGQVSAELREPDTVLDCGNSGTTLRMLAGLAASIDGLSVLTGDRSLRSRPVDRVAIPLSKMGARVDARSAGRLPPVVIRGGGLRPIRYDSPVASAQVKSAVLLAAVGGGVAAEVTSPLRSRDHTERLLRYLGLEVTVDHLPDGRERVAVATGTLTPRPIHVLGDPSAAAFWVMAAAPAIAGADGGAVVVPGVCLNPTRLGVVSVLRSMGARIVLAGDGQVAGEPAGTIRVQPAALTGAVVGGATVVDALDELPVLALAGALSRDGLEVHDAAELRVKESDRIAGLVATLAGVGVRVEPRPDGYRVAGGQRPTGGVVDAGGDHRIAMTAAIAGTLATAPVEIRGFGAVGTSYPTFLEDLRALGGTVEVIEAGGMSGRAMSRGRRAGL